MKSPIIIFAIFLTCISCSNSKNKESNQEFKNDQIAFVNSLELFKKAQLSLYKLADDNRTVSEEARTNKDSLLAFMERYKKQHMAVLEIYSEAIKEGDRVSDKYLDFLHSDFKTMYRDKFLASMKLGYELGLNGINNNYNDESISKAAEANKKVDELLQSFWGYIVAIQKDLAANHPEIKQVLVNIISEDASKESLETQKKSEDAPKKSFWRMLLRLFIADFVATIIFSFLIVLLILPFAPIMSLTEKIGSKVSTLLSLPIIIIAGVGQAYFWILWAAFCTCTVKYYMNSPTVTNNWLYYLVGFFAVTAPLGWLGHKESEAASSIDERRNTERGTMYYSFIAIIAFIVFCIWSNLLDFKYISWLNHWLY